MNDYEQQLYSRALELYHSADWQQLEHCFRNGLRPSVELLQLACVQNDRLLARLLYKYGGSHPTPHLKYLILRQDSAAFLKECILHGFNVKSTAYLAVARKVGATRCVELLEAFELYKECSINELKIVFDYGFT